MEVRNPDYVAPVNVEAPFVKHRAAVLAVLATNTDKATMSFEAIRAALPKATATALVDGELHQLLLDAGLTVTK